MLLTFRPAPELIGGADGNPLCQISDLIFPHSAILTGWKLASRQETIAVTAKKDDPAGGGNDLRPDAIRHIVYLRERESRRDSASAAGRPPSESRSNSPRGGWQQEHAQSMDQTRT